MKRKRVSRDGVGGSYVGKDASVGEDRRGKRDRTKASVLL